MEKDLFSGGNLTVLKIMRAQKDRAGMRRERRKRDNPSPVECFNTINMPKNPLKIYTHLVKICSYPPKIIFAGRNGQQDLLLAV